MSQMLDFSPHNSISTIFYGNNHWYLPACISLPKGTNCRPLVAVGKFPIVTAKLMIGKTLATNGVQITNAATGNDLLAIYW